MFNFDRRGLETSITIALIPSIKEDENQGDLVTYYFHIALNMIVGVMNSKTRNIDDAIDEQLSELDKDIRLPYIAEIVRDQVIDVKRQFISAGFDQRLKYKLVSRQCGSYKFYGIVMDLDETLLVLGANEGKEEENVTDMVSGEPTIEQLNQLYNW